MDEEFNSLQKNAWELVSLPLRRKLVQCKWVFQKKVVVDGKTCKYKARLVANGSLRSKEWTIMRPLHWLQKWTPSA